MNTALTDFVEVSNSGHILYVYDDMEQYLNNAIAFIHTGINQGHHIIFIDNSDRYQKIIKKLKANRIIETLDRIHYLDNYEFYQLYGNLHGDAIVHHFGKITEPFFKQNVTLRTWAHVEWKEQLDVFNKIKDFECTADQCVNEMGLISVCAYNGQHITGTFHNMLLSNHEYVMTDLKFSKSSLYEYCSKQTILPSFTAYKNILEKLDNFKMERKKVKEQLKASKTQLDSFIMHNLDPILMFNKEGQLITVNQAFEETFGWTSDELIGLNMLDFHTVPNNKLSEVQGNIQTLKKKKDISGYETQRIRKDGTLLDVMWSSFPIRDEKDQLDGWAVIIKDITEIKKSEQIVLQSEKLSTAGQLAASIAHEIRNPVTTVKGFLQLLQSDVKNTQHYYNIMQSEIDRIELILSEMLTLAKPQAVKIINQDIRNIVSSAIDLNEPQAILYNVQIKSEIVSEPLYIKCEENQIKQVCVNVIKNAIEAMQNQGGTLTITVSGTKNDPILLQFQDQGAGIPPHVLKQLGQPFYTTKEKGTGLGYMISKKIIEDHQGNINISSTVGKGTHVKIYLPKCLD